MKCPFKRSFIPVLFLYIVSVLFLTGCSDVPSRHAALAEDAIRRYDVDSYVSNLQTGNPDTCRNLLSSFFNSIRFADAENEIRDARDGGGKKGICLTYDLTVSYIALDRTDISALPSLFPTVDWATVTRESYSQELFASFETALSQYLDGQSFLTRRKTVTFTFEKQDGKWVVTPDDTAMRELCREYLNQVNTLYDQYLVGSEYYSVTASERVNKALSAETRYPTVFSNTSVVKIEGHSDESYEVTLDTVDYADLLSVVAERVYTAYKEDNPDGVYAPPDSSILIGMMEKEMAGINYTPVMTQIVLDSESGEADYICNLISELIEGQLEIEADEMADKIRDNMIRESVNEPRTQIRRGADNPKTYIPLKIYTPDHYDSHYFKIYDATNGEMVMNIYIREGDSITAYLPEGSYTVRYCTGKNWYGYEELFGPDGDYLRFNETFRLKKGNKYTLTLYQTADTNLTTRLLTNEDF